MIDPNDISRRFTNHTRKRMPMINFKLDLQVETPVTLDGLIASLDMAKSATNIAAVAPVFTVLRTAMQEAALYRGTIGHSLKPDQTKY